MMESNQVVITDIKIPFWSLVWLLVKLSLAALPAAFLVGAISFLGWLVMMALAR